MTHINAAIGNYSDRKIRAIYFCIYLFSAALLLAVLYEPIKNSFFEGDFLWFVAAVSHAMSTLNPCGLIKFLLAPSLLIIPSLGIPVYLILKFFGPIAGYFISFTVILHLWCSFLVFSLCRKLTLNLRVSFSSSLIYLTLFAHHGAYMWPMAMQHQLAAFFFLVVLTLYLETDRRDDEKRPYLGYYMLTLIMNLAASFCRISIVILPIAVLSHIIFCAKDSRTRVKKFYLWLPFFIAYLIYPLLTLIYVGDDRMNLYLARSHQGLAYFIFFTLGLAGLLTTGYILRLSEDYKLPRVIKFTALIVVTALSYVLLILQDKRNILLPYNLFVPFAGMLMSFLMPLQNVLMNESGKALHYIKLQINAFSFLLSLSLLVLFFKKMAPAAKKALFILVPWYLIAIIPISVQNTLASRYFIYISPVFCIIFSYALDHILALVFRASRLKAVSGEVAAVLIIGSLCVPNILAIRLEEWRGKLVNTFLSYDYIKIANAVNRNMAKRYGGVKIYPKDICVNGIRRMPAKNWLAFSIYGIDAARYDNFRFVFAQVFNDPSMADINVNVPAARGKYYYTVDDYRIVDAGGESVDPFDNVFEKALSAMKSDEHEKAKRLFQDAVTARPFLLKFLLEGLDIKDLKWITGRRDMVSWLNDTMEYPSKSRPYEDRNKAAYILAMINNEMNDYIQCLFYASYLCSISGDTATAMTLFSQIRFLESNYDTLYSRLIEIPVIKSDSAMMSFLKRSRNFLSYDDFENTYEFERFLLKLICRIELVNEMVNERAMGRGEDRL